MFDYCLKNTDKEEFDKLMLDTGLCIEMEYDDTMHIVPSSIDVIIDRIGSITREKEIDGEVVVVTYPEYYSNLRLLFQPSDELLEQLQPYLIEPRQPQSRVFM